MVYNWKYDNIWKLFRNEAKAILLRANQGYSSWKNGRRENWKNGRMECWKNGRMECWKNGRVGEWNVEALAEIPLRREKNGMLEK